MPYTSEQDPLFAASGKIAGSALQHLKPKIPSSLYGLEA